MLRRQFSELYVQYDKVEISSKIIVLFQGADPVIILVYMVTIYNSEVTT
jgi:hypothetical protein